MKIGFTGTHGVGKTTAVYELATCLKKNNKKVKINTNTARSCPLPINEDATINSQFWIFGELLKKEQESNPEEILLCDRTLLDVYCYIYRISSHVAEELEEFVRGYMYTYDVVFYMPPIPKYLVDDGKRSVSHAFQARIKEILDNYIERHDVNVVRTESNQERLDVIENGGIE